MAGSVPGLDAAGPMEGADGALFMVGKGWMVCCSWLERGVGVVAGWNLACRRAANGVVEPYRVGAEVWVCEGRDRGSCLRET